MNNWYATESSVLTWLQKKQTEELKLSAPLIEGLKKSQRERETQYGENRLKVERLENEISDMKKDLDDKVEAIARGHNHVVRLQEELGTLKRKLERLTSNNYVDESGLEDELGYYKVRNKFLLTFNSKNSIAVFVTINPSRWSLPDVFTCFANRVFKNASNLGAENVQLAQTNLRKAMSTTFTLVKTK